MNEETTKPARVPATPFFILKDLHTAREEEARAKEAERAARIDERRAARIEDDKQFIDLGDLRNSIVDRHGLKPGDASRMMAMALEIDGAPLFCRWFDPDQPYYPDGVLWALLPAGPVSLIKEDTLSWDQYDNLVAAPKGDGADIYDPLNSAVLFGRMLPRDLAIRREDACRLFGLADDELLSRFQPAQAPAQPQEDATEAQDASAPDGADPEPVAAPAGNVTPKGRKSLRPTVHDVLVPIVGDLMDGDQTLTAKLIHSKLVDMAKAKERGLSKNGQGYLVCDAANKSFDLASVEKALTTCRKNRGSTVEPPSSR